MTIADDRVRFKKMSWVKAKGSKKRASQKSDPRKDELGNAVVLVSTEDAPVDLRPHRSPMSVRGHHETASG